MNVNFIGITLEELYRAFDLLNVKYFEGKLPYPMITIQHTKKNFLGWCSTQKTWKPMEQIRERGGKKKDMRLTFVHPTFSPLWS